MPNIKVAGHVVRVTTAPGHHPDRFGRDEATFTSACDIVEAMRRPGPDGRPLYATNPSYRREVELKIARSGAATVTDADAASGIYDTLTQEGAIDREAQQAQSVGLSDHDRAMIAKFDTKASGKS